MNGYYPAAPIPNQPPPQQQPAMRNGPGGRGHQQQQSGDRRHHSRANSNGSSVETVSTASQNGTAVSSTPTSSHHTVPTNSKHAGVNTSQSTHYYNAPNHRYSTTYSALIPILSKIAIFPGLIGRKRPKDVGAIMVSHQ